jgi:hypothetical protein
MPSRDLDTVLAWCGLVEAVIVPLAPNRPNRFPAAPQIRAAWIPGSISTLSRTATDAVRTQRRMSPAQLTIVSCDVAVPLARYFTVRPRQARIF